MSATHGDPWRQRCPAGHCSWRRCSTNPPARRYYCDACGEYFAHLVDARTLGGESDGVSSVAGL